MKISDAKEVIKELYKTESVTALISERGVGKTSVFKQCAKELDIGYIDLYAAALEGPDFMGLPVKNIEQGITKYLAPSFLPTIEAVNNGIYPESGLLILEEINRVSTETISVLYPLLLERKFNGHTLAPGWRLGVTMNPDSMNYMVNTLDDAIIDRFVSISIEPDITDYINFSRFNSNANNDVLDYLKLYPDMLLIVNNETTTLIKSPTPRGWTQVQEILNLCNLKKELIQETIAGIVGPSAAASFLGYLYSNKSDIPSIENLLNNYDLVADSIARLINKNRFDALTAVIDSIISKLNTSSNHIRNLNQFLNDIPQELQIIFYRKISTQKPDILAEISDYLESFDIISDKIIDLMIS